MVRLEKAKTRFIFQQCKKGIKYICIAALIVVGLMSIIGTGSSIGGGGSSISGSGK